MDSNELISFIRDVSDELAVCAQDAEHAFDWTLANRARTVLPSLADELEAAREKGPAGAVVITELAERTSRG